MWIHFVWIQTWPSLAKFSFLPIPLPSRVICVGRFDEGEDWSACGLSVPVLSPRKLLGGRDGLIPGVAAAPVG